MNASDFTDNSLTGIATVTNGRAIITKTLVNDFSTEGTESFTFNIKTSALGPIIATSAPITVLDTSVPTVTPTTTSLNEGSPVTFNVTSDQLSTTLFWTLNPVSGSITTSDFVGLATTGSFATNGSGVGSTTLTLANDTTTEGTESFQLQVRTVSISGSIIATSATVTVLDTSLAIPLSSSITALASYMSGFMSDYKNPSFYEYTLDGDATYINDGGTDMYDVGNITTPWLIAGTNYTASIISTGNSPDRISYANTTATTVNTDFIYASVSGYTQSGTTRPLMVIGTRSGTGNPIGWQKGGNSGADGSGTLASGFVYNGTTVNGFTVYSYIRQTFGTGDPSHCDLYILLGHSNWGSTFGTVTEFADPVANGGNGGFLHTSGAGVKNVLAITTLLSKSSGVQVTNAECITVTDSIISRVKLHFGF
jgi:hypothetical protein